MNSVILLHVTIFSSFLNLNNKDNMGAKIIEDISVLGEEALYNSCPVCHYIFERGQRVVQCGNYDCKTLYHSDCFKKLQNNQCKNCGAQNSDFF